MSAESSWIPVTDDKSSHEESECLRDGRTRYYVSLRDGYRCLYAAGFDPLAAGGGDA